MYLYICIINTVPGKFFVCATGKHRSDDGPSRRARDDARQQPVRVELCEHNEVVGCE